MWLFLYRFRFRRCYKWSHLMSVCITSQHLILPKNSGHRGQRYRKRYKNVLLTPMCSNCRYNGYAIFSPELLLVWWHLRCAMWHLDGGAEPFPVDVVCVKVRQWKADRTQDRRPTSLQFLSVSFYRPLQAQLPWSLLLSLPIIPQPNLAEPY